MTNTQKPLQKHKYPKLAEPLVLLSEPIAKKIYHALSLDFPSPQSELEYTNAFTFLLAVVMSARMTDKGVNKVTRELFRLISTPEDIVAMGEEVLRDHISSIGLFKTKAKHIVALSCRLITHYNGQVPDTREDLESLPGVGRKSANVVLHVIFNRVTFPVDTHVGRVTKRTGLVAPANALKPEAVEAVLEETTPEPYRALAHHLLVLHGRYVCKGQRPQCAECSIRTWCLFEGKNI